MAEAELAGQVDAVLWRAIAKQLAAGEIVTFPWVFTDAEVNKMYAAFLDRKDDPDVWKPGP